MLDRLFTSAGRNVKRELEALITTPLPWNVRQHYFAYRYKEMLKYASQNPRTLYKMLSAQAALMDAVLKFAITDIRNFAICGGGELSKQRCCSTKPILGYCRFDGQKR